MDAPRLFLSTLLSLVLALGLLSHPSPGSAQSAGDDDGVRIGVTLGGISLVGLTLEYRKESRSAELTVGTWDFQDVSVSVVGKQYLGPGKLRPFFGLGLWGVFAFPEEGTGSVLVLKAPIGLDWRIVEGHSMGASISINRGLWLQRIDPEDDTPMNRRPVPLPAFYYRLDPF